ncbi:spore gernimation protein GerPD [Bacillus sp. JJ664]|jgi:spore germination protein PD|uniref:Putative spore germination protein GerPD n=1 Tax=Gottfriedia solisilvae TaxID=1516104 RepID=A0A8J3AK84_9BACI|nr:spore gernimation protein GerPD [Gottfriedia solisilvae]GGI15038.1 putative spore germination protein GerPD [Gottfriedia solisilvae]
MNLNVTNCNLQVDEIKFAAVSSSSLFLIGDAHNITLSSIFDTPPESLIIGPFVPLSIS